MGFEYFTIDCHRSVISAYHDYVENGPVEQHPKVSTLMTGAFNVNRPKPKYIFIWDVRKFCLILMILIIKSFVLSHERGTLR